MAWQLPSGYRERLGQGGSGRLPSCRICRRNHICRDICRVYQETVLILESIPRPLPAGPYLSTLESKLPSLDWPASAGSNPSGSQGDIPSCQSLTPSAAPRTGSPMTPPRASSNGSSNTSLPSALAMPEGRPKVKRAREALGTLVLGCVESRGLVCPAGERGRGRWRPGGATGRWAILLAGVTRGAGTHVLATTSSRNITTRLTHRLVLLCDDAHCFIFRDLPGDALAAPASPLRGWLGVSLSSHSSVWLEWRERERERVCNTVSLSVSRQRTGTGSERVKGTVPVRTGMLRQRRTDGCHPDR